MEQGGKLNYNAVPSEPRPSPRELRSRDSPSRVSTLRQWDPAFGLLINQSLRLAVISQHPKVSAAGRISISIIKRRICTAYYCIYYIQPLFLCIEVLFSLLYTHVHTHTHQMPFKKKIHHRLSTYINYCFIKSSK